MATNATTTLRVPVELRDRIARIANERAVSMSDVVSDAIDRVNRDQWWASVGDALDSMTVAEGANYRRETEGLDRSASDGLYDD